jgi:tRNA pseudouridine38-40 synthase
VPDRRFKLTLHYDGAGFNGWQVQPGVRTVQAEVEAALERLTGGHRSVLAAGRTDSGVHAIGQVASTLLPGRWDVTELERALNAVLPRDIWIAEVEEVPIRFHARYDAVARSYIYRVGTRRIARSPFQRGWCWPVEEEVDGKLLFECGRMVVGRRDFRRFAKAGQPERGYTCTVHRSEWAEWGTVGYQYRVLANRFLHHMVRFLVGTMVDVARGRRPIGEFESLLQADLSLTTSPPAPAAGLCLARVHYNAAEFSVEQTRTALPLERSDAS